MKTLGEFETTGTEKSRTIASKKRRKYAALRTLGVGAGVKKSALIFLGRRGGEIAFNV